MKKLLFFCFLCQPVLVFSQSNTSHSAVTNSQTFGYVDGIRMDSLNAEYAVFDWSTRRSFFDYGQSITRKKTRVTDEKGEPLMFATQSYSFILNFLYFNGWQFSQVGFGADRFIVKKRHDK